MSSKRDKFTYVFLCNSYVIISDNQFGADLLIEERPEEGQREVEDEDLEEHLDVSDELAAEDVVGVVQPVLLLGPILTRLVLDGALRMAEKEKAEIFVVDCI